MKLELTPDQEDEIYYKRLKEVHKAVKRGEIEFDTVTEQVAALQSFHIVRSI